MDWRWAPGGPGIQEQAAQGMAGYRPAQVAPQGYPQQGYAQQPQSQPSYDMNAYGQGLDAASLRAEYENNSARIAEIEARLATMDKEWNAGAAGRSRAALDDLDWQLARSSARHGNLDRAYNHLARIDSRTLANKDSTPADSERKRSILTELENAYIMRNAEESATAKAGWDNKIARLSKEYEDLTGEKYVYGGATPDTNVYGAGEGAGDLQAVKSKLTTFRGMRKDKRLTKAQVDELYGDASSLPNGPDKNAILGELYEAEKDSAEKADNDAATGRRKRDAAWKELKADWDNQKVKKDIGKKPGSSTTRERNGVKFTITYTGMDSAGRKRYEVSHNGKIIDTVIEE